MSASAATQLPAPESRLTQWRIRAVAVAALAATVAYLGWRLTTVDLAAWWVSVPLYLLEVHAGVGLVLFTFSLWDVDRAPDPHEPAKGRSVAVLIPTYNEPLEVLLPTVAAAVDLSPAHETWVLDDGDRAEVRDLAARLGAHYLARTEHSHAKAGNINNALGHIGTELVAVLDADHVAAPDFLTHTLGYFDDRRVAVVQTPQDFYNDDSFEHEGDFTEQALFYRVLQAGKNRWQAAFWCGTGAIVRVEALRQVGGVATETVTEDIHTSIRLHRRGWKTVYHNEVLARGLAAADAAQYQAQRLRWGTGAMQVLRTENPLFVNGLTPGQRVAYAATLLGWFDSWRSLGYLLVPMAVLLTGAVPIRSNPVQFGLLFGATFALQRLALVTLGRGRAPQRLSAVFELVRLPANLQATFALFGRKARPFNVTPKGRTGDERARIPAPHLLHGVVVASLLTAAWFGATLAGRTPTAYSVPWAAYGAAFWLVVNALLVNAAVRRIRAQRFAAERRASFRFETSATGSLDRRRCRIADLSMTGARVEVTGTRRYSPVRRLQIDGAGTTLEAAVRSRRTSGAARGQVLGLEFLPGQERARAALALYLFDHQPIGVAGAAEPVERAVPQPARRRPLSALAPAVVAGVLLLISLGDILSAGLPARD